MLAVLRHVFSPCSCVAFSPELVERGWRGMPCMPLFVAAMPLAQGVQRAAVGCMPDLQRGVGKRPARPSCPRSSPFIPDQCVLLPRWLCARPLLFIVAQRCCCALPVCRPQVPGAVALLQL